MSMSSPSDTRRRSRDRVFILVLRQEGNQRMARYDPLVSGGGGPVNRRAGAERCENGERRCGEDRRGVAV
jgi:hypothetical protein